MSCDPCIAFKLGFLPLYRDTFTFNDHEAQIWGERQEPGGEGVVTVWPVPYSCAQPHNPSTGHTMELCCVTH